MRDVSAATDGNLIAIDGKVLRSSYNREDRKSTIHMVSAFTTANGVVIGQVKTLDKSNEITATTELLKLWTSAILWFQSMRWAAKPRLLVKSSSKVEITCLQSKVIRKNELKRFK